MERNINNNTNRNSNTNRKLEFAFSAIMFFAPLIKNDIKNNNYLSNEDKIFINWYIKLWYINITILIITILLWIIQLLTKNLIIKRISIVFLILLAILLIIWAILVALNKNLNPNNVNIEWKQDFDKLLYFIPIYNIYIWYENHNFEWENSIIKCSIILRSIFTLVAVFVTNIYINIFIVCIILFIALCNINWISFWTKLKNFFNQSFFKNPEEIRWYISWLFYSLFNKKWIKNNINEQKKQYEFIFKADNKQIITEYIILSILCIIGIYIWIYYWKYTILVWDIFIILRYLIMVVKRNHLPHIPILKWITDIFFKSNNIKNE